MVIVMAKVKVMDEDDMDSISENEKYGIEPKSVAWEWQKVAVHQEDIKRVYSYSKTKCVIVDYDNIQTLVKEPFEEVVKKIEEAIEEYDGGQEVEEQSTEEIE